MTEDELFDRIYDWQQRLALLGISHWRIDEVVIGPDPPGSDGSDASVRWMWHYDSCKFYFRDDFLDGATEQELDETIIHEWLHVATKEFDVVNDAAKDHMSPAVWSGYYGRFAFAQEKLLERMARQLYEFYTTIEKD